LGVEDPVDGIVDAVHDFSDALVLGGFVLEAVDVLKKNL
jgi:hypothetical protein